MQISEILDIPPFSLQQPEKENLLFGALKSLHLHHAKHANAYRNYCDRVFPDHTKANTISDLPYLPVRVFKNHDLKSIPQEGVFKVLTSSGTTGQVPSRIYLDKETARLQTLALSKIVTQVIGNKRLPMLIIDSQSVLSNRQSFSARGAGILGLSVFGSNHCYALNDEMQLDEEKMEKFLEKFNGKSILIFGFTFMVWLYLYQAVKNKKYDLSNAYLIHSGGWKKLTELAVDNSVFKQKLREKFGMKPENIFNFYGMVEQVGSVFIENKAGFLHCPNFSDVIIRNPDDLSVQPHGKEGLIQVVSALPLSYPGHSILTEDIGVCEGEDNEPGGWKGKYFRISGRAKMAELRGCSDTFNKPLHVS